MNRIVSDLPFKDYLADESISGSLLVKCNKSMRHGHWYKTHSQETNREMDWGTILHAAVLEPERFFKEAVIWTGKKKSGKAWDAFEEENQDRIIITQKQCDDVRYAVDSVLSNQDAMEKLKDCKKEQSIFWSTPEYGNARARPDGLCQNYSVSYKTTAQIHPQAVQRTAYNMGYHIKEGWIQVGLRELTGNVLPVWVIWQEASGPFDVLVDEYDSVALAAGRQISQALAARYRACEKSGLFPGVRTEIGCLKIPTWAMQGDNPIALAACNEMDELEAKDL